MRQYAGLAEVWAADATLAYGPMARHLVDRAPFDLGGVRALDAGAGSGVAGDALRARGARVVAADREFDMASYGARPAVTADVTALPFRSGAFDVVVAAFVVNHLPDPTAGLTELRRVTRARRCGAGLDVLGRARGGQGRGGWRCCGVRLRRPRVVRRPPGVRARRGRPGFVRAHPR